jgi:hypothetical protein
MRPLSRAIHGIPRPYLHNRRAGSIFPVRGWNVLARQGILPGRVRSCRALESGRYLLARLVEARHGGRGRREHAADLSISPDKVCYIIAKAREFDAKES